MSSTLRGLAHVLFRHKRKIGAILAVSLGAAAAFSLLMPRHYRAEATILVKLGREDNASTRIDEAVGSQIEILKNGDLHQRVAAAVGTQTLYPALPPAEAANAFGRDLHVAASPGSTVIELAYDNPDPAVAAMGLNRLLDEFRDKHRQLYGTSKSGFLESQAESVRDQLKAAQARLAAFRQSNKVYALEEQRQLLLRQRADIDSQSRAAQSQIGELQERLRTLQAQIRETPPTIALSTETDRNKLLDEARAKLMELQLREQELLGKYKDTSQYVIGVRDEIRRAKAIIKDLDGKVTGVEKSGPNEVWTALQKDFYATQAQMTALQGRQSGLAGQIRELDAKLEGLNRQEGSSRDLEREVAGLEASYQTYLQKIEEARIADDAARNKGAGIGVIQQAAEPDRPNRPHPLLVLLVALAGGLAAGIGTAAACEYFSQRFATPAAVERRLGLPVLTSIASEP